MENDHPIQNNIEKIKKRILAAALESKRDPNKIKLIAVSKYHDSKSILEAYQNGLRDFGENYVQEWKEKYSQLHSLNDISWHIIGPIQSNKVKYLNDSVKSIQSICSMSTVKELEKKWIHKTPVNIFVQLSVDKDDLNKSGLNSADASELISYILRCPQLSFAGFMGMGPINRSKSELETLYNYFYENCMALWRHHQCAGFPEISLGMSQDLEIAIACGATIIRVGTDIFGKPNLS